ncbi:hypothetical protein DFH06DRAFT_1124340 [Mycena polygramma]|nr:hypothetical protein DFH06DRAFT_1124340 [Mycena polygramma]
MKGGGVEGYEMESRREVLKDERDEKKKIIDGAATEWMCKGMGCNGGKCKESGERKRRTVEGGKEEGRQKESEERIRKVATGLAGAGGQRRVSKVLLSVDGRWRDEEKKREGQRNGKRVGMVVFMHCKKTRKYALKYAFSAEVLSAKGSGGKSQLGEKTVVRFPRSLKIEFDSEASPQWPSVQREALHARQKVGIQVVGQHIWSLPPMPERAARSAACEGEKSNSRSAL